MDFQLAQTFAGAKDVLTAEIILNNSLVLEIRREVAIMISLLYSDLEYERADYTNVERWNASIEKMGDEANVRIAPFILYNINYNRARAARSLGDPATAEALLLRNIGRYPNVRQAYTELYNLYIGYTMWDKAADLEKTLKSCFAKSYAAIDTPGLKKAFETAPLEGRLGFYTAYRNFGRAVEIASAMNQTDPDHRIFLAKLYYWEGRGGEGRAVINALEREHAGDTEVLNKIGSFYLKDIYRAAEAVEFFRKSLAVDKEQPEIAYTASRVERDYLARLKPLWKE